ncbi:MAG: hypothetical protein AAFW70_30010 [Cyanobacteria bacterium J06635_10]
MVVDPLSCLGTDNLRSGNTLGTERAETKERTQPLVGSLRPAVKDKPCCVVHIKYGAAGRGSSACGERVRPICACMKRHHSMKREAQKTNKTVSE